MMWFRCLVLLWLGFASTNAGVPRESLEDRVANLEQELAEYRNHFKEFIEAVSQVKRQMLGKLIQARSQTIIDDFVLFEICDKWESDFT